MRLLIFDMDGVLVDPAESYRRVLIEVVRDFSGRRIGHDVVVEWKNQGGYNDDGVLAHRILQEMGCEVTPEEVMAYGERLFWGAAEDGLILRERWLAEEGLLERLAEEFRLAVFTGRRMKEARFTLDRFAAHIRFDPVMTSDQHTRHKPHPQGLLRILEAAPGAEPLFVGDNVDDARAARAAGVPFIAVAAPDAPHRERTVQLFEAENALAVVENVNQLEQVAPARNSGLVFG